MTTYQPAAPHSVSIQHSVTSSVVPLFRDGAFDAEATQAMGNAYDIACRSLRPKGRLPVIQELLAKTIVQATQRGERDPERLAVIALEILGRFHSDITRRFGLVPNFFMSAPDAPEIVERLWDFAKSAYLDNPMPPSSRSACSFSCHDFAKSAIASFVTAGFWPVTAIHRVMLPLCRKTSSKCSGF